MKYDFDKIFKGRILTKTTKEILSAALSSLMGYSMEFLSLI